ncbi:MAG TPA: sensor histidine kinase, partial [Brevundimonas sp.]|nr:sensor histidine kinase [Brevundimonas sp.]
MTRLRALLSDVRKGLRVPADWRERVKFHAPDALAWRLLLLTFVFAASVEVLIIAPSAASFHERWLLDRLQSAELASVGVEALPYSAVEDDTAEQLLA